MDLSELRTYLTDLLSFDLDNVKAESPTDAQLDAQINEALRVISKAAWLFDPKVVLTLKLDTFIYNLQDLATVERTVVRPFQATINENKLWNKVQDAYGMWSWGEFVSQHPTWEDDTAGTPTKAVLYGSRRMIVHLAPTAAVVSAGENYVAGQVLAKALVAANDEPDEIPVEAHEAIAHLAAYRAAMPSASAAEAWNRLDRYNRDWREVIKEVRNENRRIFLSGTTYGRKSRTFLNA